MYIYIHISVYLHTEAQLFFPIPLGQGQYALIQLLNCFDSTSVKYPSRHFFILDLPVPVRGRDAYGTLRIARLAPQGGCNSQELFDSSFFNPEHHGQSPFPLGDCRLDALSRWYVTN